MCGLAGFINFSNNEALAIEAGHKQYHRGPDAQSIWNNENITLSHQRLSIIDLDSRSNQPFVKNGLVIVFNGEIYNYKELKDKIYALDPLISFVTTSDTEVLLELYRLKGEKCLDDLIGMYVFAIYEIETGRLFVARDHFGIKPLFYTKINNSFAFASELKTLINIPGFDKNLNYTALLGSINYLWVPGNESIFRNCFKLPPAHYMTIDTKGSNLSIEVKKYWNLNTITKYFDEERTISNLDKCIKD